MRRSDPRVASALAPPLAHDVVAPARSELEGDAAARPTPALEPDDRAVGAARHARRACSLFLRFAAGAVAALVLSLVAPLVMGGRPLVVLSGSMAPTLDVGDVVVSLRIEPLQARPGDIVTFRDPDDAGRLVTHRVRRVSAHGTRVSFVTRGDANNASERWEVGVEERIGRSVLRVPKVGYALSILQTPLGFAVLLLVPLGLLLVLELVSIWKPSAESADDGPG